MDTISDSIAANLGTVIYLNSQTFHAFHSKFLFVCVYVGVHFKGKLGYLVYRLEV